MEYIVNWRSIERPEEGYNYIKTVGERHLFLA